MKIDTTHKSLNRMTRNTAKAREALIDLTKEKPVRLGSRFTYGVENFLGLISDGVSSETISLVAFADKIGIRLDGQTTFELVVNKVCAYFGVIPDTKLTMRIAQKFSQQVNTVLPASFVFDCIGISRQTGVISSKKKSRRRGKNNSSRSRTTRAVVNIRTAAMAFFANYFGSQTNRTLDMELYAYSPSIRTIDKLFGTQAVNFQITLFGRYLVITTSDIRVVQKDPTTSRMTTNDINSANHEVPAQMAWLKLIDQGWIEISEFGITDVDAFVETAYAHGLNQAHENWLDTIAQIDSVNPKIATVTQEISQAKNLPVSQRAKALGKISATVCDDVTIEVNVPELVGAAAGYTMPQGFDTSWNPGTVG